MAQCKSKSAKSAAKRKTSKKRKLERKEIMAKGVKHYFKDGTEHKGATHKDARAKLCLEQGIQRPVSI